MESITGIKSFEKEIEKKVKILFLGGDTADYLNIGILNGLHQLEGMQVIEYPAAEALYKSNEEKLKKYIRGNAFSLYFLLEDEYQKRFHIAFEEIPKHEFDLIIIGDIHNSFGYLLQYLPYMNTNNTVILDGADTPSLFPYNGKYWRNPVYWFLPRVHKHFLYFKREWTLDTLQYRWFKLIPKWMCNFLPAPKNLRHIGFCIPEEKIVKEMPNKTKNFPKHIVDKDICKYIVGSSIQYAFENESAYYADLQSSKYGITTKRAGWDCLRHYEIAANGAVICFKDLDQKPSTCAPHGLIPGVNCISFKNYHDLIKQIECQEEKEYNKMQKKSLEWVLENSSKTQAVKLLNTWISNNEKNGIH